MWLCTCSDSKHGTRVSAKTSSVKQLGKMTVTQACVDKYAFYTAQTGYFPLGLDKIQLERTKEFRVLRKCLKTESQKKPKLLKKSVSH